MIQWKVCDEAMRCKHGAHVRRALLIPLLLLCLTITANAVFTNVSISQAVQQEGMLHLYFSMLDEGGVPVELTGDAAVSLSVGGIQRDCTIRPAQQENIGYVFAVDISSSLDDATFQQVRDALDVWVNHISDQDAAALLTFGDKVTVVSDFSRDRDTLKALIAELTPTDQTTQLHNGLTAALGVASRRGGDLPERRVVIVLTDGNDEAVAGATLSEVSAMVEETALPLYVIGFDSQMEADLTALDSLGEIARKSGGAYLPSGASFTETYGEVFDRIGRSYLLEAALSPEDATDSTTGVTITVHSGELSLRGSTDLRLEAFQSVEPSPEPDPEPTPEPLPVPEEKASFRLPLPLLLGGAAAVSVAVLAVLLILRRNKRRRNEQETARTEREQLDREIENQYKTGGGTDGTRLMASTTGSHTRILRASQASPDLIRLTLERDGKQTEHKLALIGEIRVGRVTDGNTLAISGDDAVSTHHFTLRAATNGRLLLRDLGSTNGTWLIRGTNRIRLEPETDTPVASGERFQAGETLIQIDLI